ncbi:MAG: hypothetical protein RLO48_19235, partial [Bauldia litoralis]
TDHVAGIGVVHGPGIPVSNFRPEAMQASCHLARPDVHRPTGTIGSPETLSTIRGIGYASANKIIHCSLTFVAGLLTSADSNRGLGA